MTRHFIMGAVAMGFFVAAAFFLRFWRESRDRLFAFFAVAFLLLAINRPLVALLERGGNFDLSPYFYLSRLAAYIIIIIAIVDKNLRRT